MAVINGTILFQTVFNSEERPCPFFPDANLLSNIVDDLLRGIYKSRMTNLSINQLKQAIQIKEQIEKLESQMHRIMGGIAKSSPVRTLATKVRKTMSAAGRARIAAAQKARWAKIKGAAKSAVAKVKASTKKKGGMSPEGRARIVAAQKARWAKIKSTSKPAKKASKKKSKMSAAARAKLAAAMKARWAVAKKKGISLTARKK